MMSKQRIDEILQQQHTSLLAVLNASMEVLNSADAFSIESVEELAKLRSSHVEVIKTLEQERAALDDGEHEYKELGVTTAINAVRADLAIVDGQLQDLMRRRQVMIINNMASVRNRVKLNNSVDTPLSGHRVVDVIG